MAAAGWPLLLQSSQLPPWRRAQHAMLQRVAAKGSTAALSRQPPAALSRLALHTPAGQLPAEGVKRLHDSLPAARRPRSMSPGTAVDALWHWMLLNTRVSAAVHELLGGVVEHVGTDEEDLDDDAKMMQRLYSMGLMAAEGWTPDERLWTERGTLMEAVAAVSSADGITLYATPHTSAAQRQQLAEDLQVVHVGVMRENGWARPAAAQPGSAAAAEAGPDAAMEVEAVDGGSEAADEGAEQLFLKVPLLSRKQAVHRGLSVWLPAGATAADVKQALRDSDDAVVAAAAAQRSCLYSCGVGQLQDGDVLGQRGISSGHVLRLQLPPRLPAWANRLWLQLLHARANEPGARVRLDGRVAPWLLVRALQQVVQAVEGTPAADQALYHTLARSCGATTHLSRPTSPWTAAPTLSCAARCHCLSLCGSRATGLRWCSRCQDAARRQRSSSYWRRAPARRRSACAWW